MKAALPYQVNEDTVVEDIDMDLPPRPDEVLVRTVAPPGQVSPGLSDLGSSLCLDCLDLGLGCLRVGGDPELFRGRVELVYQDRDILQ